MNRLSVLGLGLSFGATLALYYLGCVLIMTFIGKDATIFFFNSLLHGLDTTLIIRMNVSLLEQFVGLIFTFILGWIFGALVAVFYNLIPNRD